MRKKVQTGRLADANSANKLGSKNFYFYVTMEADPVSETSEGFLLETRREKNIIHVCVCVCMCVCVCFVLCWQQKYASREPCANTWHVIHVLKENVFTSRSQYVSCFMSCSVATTAYQIIYRYSLISCFRTFNVISLTCKVMYERFQRYSWRVESNTVSFRQIANMGNTYNFCIFFCFFF